MRQPDRRLKARCFTASAGQWQPLPPHCDQEKVSGAPGKRAGTTAVPTAITALREKGGLKTQLSCPEIALGRGCDHPETSRVILNVTVRRRGLLQVPTGAGTNRAAVPPSLTSASKLRVTTDPNCQAPRPLVWATTLKREIWAFVAYLNCFHYSNCSNYLNCSSWL